MKRSVSFETQEFQTVCVAQAPRGFERANVRVTELGLCLGDRCALPFQDLTHAVTFRTDGCHSVALFGLSGRPIVLDAPDAPTARALLASLGWNVTRRPLRLLVDSRWMQRLPRYVSGAHVMASAALLALLSITAVSQRAVTGWSLGLLFVWFVPFVALFSPRGITVALDGVRVEESWGARSFIPFRDVTGVELDDARVVLRLTSGAREVISRRWLYASLDGRLSARRSQSAWANSLADDLLAIFEEHRRGQAPVDDVLTRPPDGSSVGAWINTLRAHGRLDASYRTASQGRDALLRTATDARVSPEVRVAAAIAIGDALDPSQRAELRLAADTAASPSLAKALEAALEGDPEKIETTLRALSQG